MIMIYGTNVSKDNISRFILQFFHILNFEVDSGAKQKFKKWPEMTIMSVTFHI